MNSSLFLQLFRRSRVIVLLVLVLLLPPRFATAADEKISSVRDVPIILISGENVEFGISYKITGTSTVSTKQSFSYAGVDTFSESGSLSITSSRNVKTTVANDIAVKLGASVGAITKSLSMGIEASRTATTIFDYSQNFTSASLAKYDIEKRKFDERTSSQQISYDENSGYIASALRVRNLSGKIAKITKVAVRFVELSLETGEEINTIQVVRVDDFEVPPSDASIPYFSVPVRLSAIATDRILNIKDSGRIIKMAMQQYAIEYAGNEIIPSILSRELAKKAIKVNIIDQAGRFSPYYVQGSSSNNYAVSLEEALNLIYSSKVIIRKESGKSDEIAKLDGIESEFQLWGDPRRYSRQDLSQGAWVVLPSAANLVKSDMQSPAPPNSEYTIYYLKKSEIWEKFRTQSTEISKPFGDQDLTTGSYYWTYSYPPSSVEIENANNSVREKFKKVDNRFRPEVLRDPEFKVNSGDLLRVRLHIERSPLTAEPLAVSFQWVSTCSRNCVGSPPSETGVVTSVPLNFRLNLDSEYVIRFLTFRFANSTRALSLNDLRAYGIYPVLNIRADGYINVEFVVNDLVAPVRDTTFSIELQPQITPIQFGIKTFRKLSTGRVWENGEVYSEAREPRKGDLIVSIARRLFLSDEEQKLRSKQKLLPAKSSSYLKAPFKSN